MEENKVACNYEEMYKQEEAENRYLNMQLEEQGKWYENRINNLENELKKYEKENCQNVKTLLKENQELKERLERIDNYLYKYYTVENQFWFDHIRDIVKDR